MIIPGCKIYGNGKVIAAREKLALTFGNFDGVHLGHQHVLSELKNFAGGIPVAVITFDPHPSHVFFPAHKKPLITPVSVRVELLLKAGVDIVLLQEFSEEFSSLSADGFCEHYLKRNFQVDGVFLGCDLKYGAGRQGNFEHLKEFAKKENWRVGKASPFFLEGKQVSSTEIREAIVRGEVDTAERFLGYPYALHGHIFKGDQRGRQLGFPTANLAWKNDLLPKSGVYSCMVEIEKSKVLLPAVMNCGYRPTIAGDKKLQIEAHILDFEADLYGKSATYYLKHFIRDEKKFAGLDELQTQIIIDADMARKLLTDTKV
jgi:riboflavin kinase/FMN adenylyltransferase